VIRATRRGALAGALALPAAVSLAKSPRRKASGTILLHDPSLKAGRRFAAAGRARGEQVQAIRGDRIRFARAVFERSPALIVGVSRSADALLIEEVGREAGYAPAKSGIALDSMLSATGAGDGAFAWVLART